MTEQMPAISPDSEEEASRELVVIQTALDYVTDDTRPLRERALTYAILRRIKLRIERVLRKVTPEIAETMVRENTKRWGPIRLTWRARDPVWVVNEPGNWDDAGVQGYMEEWEGVAAYREFIKRIPAHREVDAAALAKAMINGDGGAEDLFNLLNELGLRVVPQRDATITVDE